MEFKIKAKFFLIFFACFQLTNLYAGDEFKSALKSFNAEFEHVGIIDYKENCSSCSHETHNKYPLGKLVSISNNQVIELSVVSEEELSKYFDELANNKDIPFLYAYDGCYARAHKMSQILEGKGIISGKAFVEGNLNVTSPLLGAVNWWYHVAPVVLVKKDGKEIPYVIDPSLFNKPIPFTEWRDLMTSAKKENLKNEYFTNRFSYTPNDKNPPPKVKFSKRDLKDTQATMLNYQETLKKIQEQK